MENSMRKEKNSMEDPQKIKNKTISSAPGNIYTYAKVIKTLTQKDICTPMFIAALFKIANTWKQPVSING